MSLRSVSIKTTLACLISVSISSTGCYRARYVAFSPSNADRPVLAEPTTTKGGSWRSFFLWGWVPEELEIDAQALCGGTERIESIETRQTFAQGLVASLAGFYVNVYSPYNGVVACRGEP